MAEYVEHGDEEERERPGAGHRLLCHDQDDVEQDDHGGERQEDVDDQPSAFLGALAGLLGRVFPMDQGADVRPQTQGRFLQSLGGGSISSREVAWLCGAGRGERRTWRRRRKLSCLLLWTGGVAVTVRLAGRLLGK